MQFRKKLSDEDWLAQRGLQGKCSNHWAIESSVTGSPYSMPVDSAFLLPSIDVNLPLQNVFRLDDIMCRKGNGRLIGRQKHWNSDAVPVHVNQLLMTWRTKVRYQM